MRFLFLLILLAGTVPGPAGAAEKGAPASKPSVRWEVGATAPLSANAFIEVSLRYQHCRPLNSPAPALAPRLAIAASHEAPSLLFKSLTLSRGAVQSFLVWCDPAAKRLDLPALTVRTSAGDQKAAALSLPLALPPSKIPVINGPTFLRAKVNLPDRPLWHGEVLPLTYTVEGSLAASGKLVVKNPAPTQSRPWLLLSQPAPGAAARFRWDMALKVPDEPAFSAAFAQDVQWTPPGQAPRQARLVTALSPVAARALPPAPAGFQGAIGRFQLTSRSAGAGKAAAPGTVEVQLELSGAGSIPLAAFPQPLPDPCVSLTQTESPADSWLVEPNQRMTSTLTAKPAADGKCLLAWQPFCYFDPAAGAYFQLSPSPVKIGSSP